MNALSGSLSTPGSCASKTLLELQESWRRNSARLRRRDDLPRPLIALERRFGTKEDEQ